MGEILIKIGLFIGAYLVGSIPNGLWIGKLFKKIDLREEGSKNIGASNAFRILGFWLGFFTLILDVLKSALVVLIIKYLLPESYSIITLFNLNLNITIIYGLSAILGHSYSVFLKFKGGKAVAASLGVVFSLTPLIGVIALLTYIIVVLTTHYASLGSTIATLLVGVGTTIRHFLLTPEKRDLLSLIIYWVIIVIIIIRHLPNYKRLLKKEENKLYFTNPKKNRNSSK